MEEVLRGHQTKIKTERKGQGKPEKKEKKEKKKKKKKKKEKEKNGRKREDKNGLRFHSPGKWRRSLTRQKLKRRPRAAFS